jgi:hypothetical protein
MWSDPHDGCASADDDKCHCQHWTDASTAMAMWDDDTELVTAVRFDSRAVERRSLGLTRSYGHASSWSETDDHQLLISHSAGYGHATSGERIGAPDDEHVANDTQVNRGTLGEISFSSRSRSVDSSRSVTSVPRRRTSRPRFWRWYATTRRTRGSSPTCRRTSTACCSPTWPPSRSRRGRR